MGWLLALTCVVPQDQDKREADLLKRVEELERIIQGGEAPGLPGRAAPSKRDAGEVYSKSFLERFGRNVYLGGYVDFEYVRTKNADSDTFDQHRFVPFIYADVSDHVKMASEIEIEHGEEVGIEFAHVDYLAHDWINFRAGIILDPLGHFNLVHDAPYQDLTLRPLMNQVVIPAVLREPGVGFFGTVDVDPWKFDYEAYVVNGFKGLDKAGNTTIDTTNGLRNARPHKDALGSKGFRDFNHNKAFVSRVSVSPFLGLEAGGSVHTGLYDAHEDNRLTVWAVDWTADLGGVAFELGLPDEFLSRFEVVGEFAWANVDRDAFARAAGVPDDFHGSYVETRFHVMPDFLKESIPGAGEESTFTLVYRHGRVDLNGAERGENFFGLNFRFTEDTVFKVEYVFRDESGTLNETGNDQVVASVATYF